MAGYGSAAGWVSAVAASLAAMTAVGTGAQAAHAVTTPHGPAANVTICGAGGLELPGAGLPGGYRCAAAPYASDVNAAARALYTAATRPLPAHRHGFRVLSAATQVVAGENYKLVLAVSADQPEIIIGTVYRPLTGPVSISNSYVIAHAPTPVRLARR